MSSSSSSSSHLEKFRHLPGIDIKNPEKYEHKPESSDESLHNILKNNKAPTSYNSLLIQHPDIDASPIDPLKAFSSLQHKKELTDKFEISEIPVSHKPQESILEKYRRLNFELDELFHEVNNPRNNLIDKEIKRYKIDKEVEQMKSRLEQVVERDEVLKYATNPEQQISQYLERQQEINESLDKKSESFNKKNLQASKKEQKKAPNHSRGDEQISRFIEMERRIASLERMIGATDEDKHLCLDRSISQIEKKLSLLDPELLDSIQTKMKGLNIELDSIINKKETLDSKSLDKIDKLYDSVERWDDVVDQLPSLVSRLQTLKLVHDESISFKDSLKNLTEQHKNITIVLKKHEGMMNDVEKKCEDNITIIQKNLESFDKRASLLLEKIQKMPHK